MPSRSPIRWPRSHVTIISCARSTGFPQRPRKCNAAQKQLYTNSITRAGPSCAAFMTESEDPGAKSCRISKFVSHLNHGHAQKKSTSWNVLMYAERIRDPSLIRFHQASVLQEKGGKIEATRSLSPASWSYEHTSQYLVEVFSQFCEFGGLVSPCVGFTVEDVLHSVQQWRKRSHQHFTLNAR